LSGVPVRLIHTTDAGIAADTTGTCVQLINKEYVLSCNILLITTRRELRSIMYLAASVCAFLLCVKYLGNRWTDFHQGHKEDVFGPLLGRDWM